MRVYFLSIRTCLQSTRVRSALGIGRTGVYRLLESRQIKCFKIGNTYKIPKSALIAFVAQSCGSSREGGDEK